VVKVRVRVRVGVRFKVGAKLRDRVRPVLYRKK
jgi:hypothetical protein